MMNGMDWGWMLSGGLGMLLFWGVLIVLVVLALRGLAGGATNNATGDNLHHAPAPSPLEILQARYARGEISQEEYREMKATLHL
jgi:putative membrane protein